MKQYFKQYMLNNGMDANCISSYFTYVKKSYEKFMRKDCKKYPTIYDRLDVLTKHSRVIYCEYLISLIKATASAGVKFIFQLPAITVLLF